MAFVLLKSCSLFITSTVVSRVVARGFLATSHKSTFPRVDPPTHAGLARTQHTQQQHTLREQVSTYRSGACMKLHHHAHPRARVLYLSHLLPFKHPPDCITSDLSLSPHSPAPPCVFSRPSCPLLRPSYPPQRCPLSRAQPTPPRPAHRRVARAHEGGLCAWVEPRRERGDDERNRSARAHGHG